MPPFFADAIWLSSFGLHECHRPGRHVVVPHTEVAAVRWLRDSLDRAHFGHVPSLLFTFWGGPHGAGFAARNATIAHWGGKFDRGFSVGNYTGRNVYEDIANSTFCGAPHGGGWGSRLTIAILHGCIPVVMQDDSSLPLEPFLDYSEFSVRVPLADIPDLERILRAVTPERVRRMRSRVLEVAPYFVWDSRAGGRAFEGVMHAILRRGSMVPKDG